MCVSSLWALCRIVLGMSLSSGWKLMFILSALKILHLNWVLQKEKNNCPGGVILHSILLWNYNLCFAVFIITTLHAACHYQAQYTSTATRDIHKLFLYGA